MSQSTDPPAAPISPQTPHRPADDQEEVYFDGSPMLRAEWSSLSLLILLGLVLIFIGIAPLIWNWGWPWWVIGLFWIVGIALPFVLPLWLKTLRYRISNYRIDFEHGVLTKQIDTMELWHVDDLRFRQSLVQRILGVGTISVFSQDDTTPDLELRGLPHPRQLFESLKQRVIAVKRQRGVIKMDLG
jgi:uncharacterized membrane protein YdbT with pleckstrin-like domain